MRRSAARAGDAPRALGPDGPLLERQGELGALAHALGAAREGRGAVVAIEARLGLGKGRLLEEARLLAGRAGLGRAASDVLAHAVIERRERAGAARALGGGRRPGRSSPRSRRARGARAAAAARGPPDGGARGLPRVRAPPRRARREPAPGGGLARGGGMALALDRLGQRSEAGRLLSEEPERARAFGLARSIARALEALGAIAAGGRGLDYLAEAEAALEGSKRPRSSARELSSAAGRRRSPGGPGPRSRRQAGVRAGAP
jgi:hypothetical protein